MLEAMIAAAERKVAGCLAAYEKACADMAESLAQAQEAHQPPGNSHWEAQARAREALRAARSVLAGLHEAAGDVATLSGAGRP